jgi:hypothetical protein
VDSHCFAGPAQAGVPFKRRSTANSELARTRAKSIFLRRVNEALLLKKISRRTANHFMSVYKKFDTKKRSEADDKADELLAELISESSINQRR